MGFKQIFRTLLLALTVLIVAGIYIVNLMQMQIVDGAYYLEESNKKQARSILVEAARGEITDRYGRPFAKNRMSSPTETAIRMEMPTKYGTCARAICPR